MPSHRERNWDKVRRDRQRERGDNRLPGTRGGEDYKTPGGYSTAPRGLPDCPWCDKPIHRYWLIIETPDGWVHRECHDPLCRP